MHLRSLVLENFRCYERVELRFARGLNAVLGPNASGKTTILEAIYLLSTTTSPRSGSAKEMIRHGESWARVTGVFTVRDRDLTMRMTLGDPSGGRSGRKTIEVDGREIASRRRAVGRVQSVLFWIGELEVVKGPPSERRSFLNQAIGQMSARYLDDLARYRRALRQRNELLKEIARGGRNGRALAPWTRTLVEAGAAITIDRAEYLAALGSESSALHERLGVGAEALSVNYAPSVGVSGNEEDVTRAFHETLAQMHDREVERGSTQTGPHRDDVTLAIDDVDLRRFGSQGQQRTAALALKLAQARVARARTEDQPILLLDDCLSELDVNRCGAMLDLSHDHEQMIVTSACCPEELERRLADARVITTDGTSADCGYARAD